MPESSPLRVGSKDPPVFELDFNLNIREEPNDSRLVICKAETPPLVESSALKR
jgi:hypothetical protein